jgi:hypothetical protein
MALARALVIGPCGRLDSLEVEVSEGHPVLGSVCIPFESNHVISLAVLLYKGASQLGFRRQKIM